MFAISGARDCTQSRAVLRPFVPVYVNAPTDMSLSQRPRLFPLSRIIVHRHIFLPSESSVPLTIFNHLIRTFVRLSQSGKLSSVAHGNSHNDSSDVGNNHEPVIRSGQR